MYATVHRASVVVFAAEICASRGLLVTRHMHGVVHEFVNALVACGRNAHHRNAEDTFHLVDPDGAAVASDLVHHIKSQHHRDFQLHQLQGEIEVTFDVGSVHYVDEATGVGVEYELAGHDFLGGIWRQRIYAGKVGNLGARPAPYGTFFTIDRHAREVAHMLVGTGKDIE